MHTRTNDRNKQPRAKDGFDPALLCSKLEAHKREQDAARARREKRDAVKTGRFVPRSAAKSFAVTTSMPMREVPKPSKNRRHQPEGTIISTDREACFPAEKLYTSVQDTENSKVATKAAGPSDPTSEALDEKRLDSSIPWPKSEILDESPVTTLRSSRATKSLDQETQTLAERRGSPKVAELLLSVDKKPEYARKPETQVVIDLDNWDKAEAEKRHSEPSEARDSMEVERKRVSASSKKSKHDSMSPATSDHEQGARSQNHRESAPRRSSDGAPRARHSAKPPSTSPDRNRLQYRPGDAAKRRSVMGTMSAHKPADNRPISFHAFQFEDTRLSKFRETELQEGAISEAEEIDPKARPPLVAHDRPDWCQSSQNGDDMRRTLHFHLPSLPKMLPEKKDKSSRKGSAVEANGMAPAPPHQAQEMPRKLSGPQHEHLIADAVAIIKHQKRDSRRGSLFGLFKGL